MKTLAIIATRRKNGLISKITSKVIEGAQSSGHETEIINLFDFKIEY